MTTTGSGDFNFIGIRSSATIRSLVVNAAQGPQRPGVTLTMGTTKYSAAGGVGRATLTGINDGGSA